MISSVSLGLMVGALARLGSAVPAPAYPPSLDTRFLSDPEFHPAADGTWHNATAHRMAAAIEVGLCWINSWFLRDLRTAFGGAKASGIGREGGVHSLEFYTELRNVMVKL